MPLIRRYLVLGAGFVTFTPGFGPSGEVARGDVDVGLGHKVLQEMDIMQREQRATELFAGVVQVAQVSAREMAAGVIVHAFHERTVVIAVAEVLHADWPVGRERAAVATDARGHGAVEHIGTERDHAEELGRGADAHDVTRLVFGEERRDQADLMEHMLLGLADAHAADGVAGEIESTEFLGATDTQVVVDRALVDAEEMTAGGQEAAVLGQLEHLLGPADGAVYRDFACCALAGVGWTFVEHHGDV